MKCDKCGRKVESRREEIEHVLEKHGDKITSHERDELKRELNSLESGSGPSSSLPLRKLGIAAAVLAVILGGGYALSAAGVLSFSTGSDGGPMNPYGHGSVHEHGSIEVIIEGEEIDFSRSGFLGRDNAFHFHSGYYDQYGTHVWHKHAQGVTLQYALETLGIDVNSDGTNLSYNGETYSASDSGTEIIIEVNGEPVEPGTYQLQGVGPEGQAAEGQGDSVHIEVRTDGGT